MLFGFADALVNFQKYINKIFVEKLNIFIIVYLDNILIYSNDNGDNHIIAIQ